MLALIKKLFEKQSATSQVNTETGTPLLDPAQRILFIGFGKVPGFYSCDWRDWKWQNAADFETVFINCETLATLLVGWKQQYDANEEAFAVKPVVTLSKNLEQLRNQLLQVITSDRAVFAFGVPDAHFQFDTREGNIMAGRYIAITPFSWCPLPVDTVIESGQVTRDVDARFASYRRQIKEWTYYYDVRPQRVEYIEKKMRLSPDKLLALTTDTLFENLSRNPLGVELRLRIYVGLREDPYGDLVRLRIPEPTDQVSGPIFLLHYPTGGDRTEAIRCLLREFHKTDIIVTETPDWLGEVVPPKGEELNAAIDELSEQIAHLVAERSRMAAEKGELEKWRCLLYETGDALEDIVLRSLELIGLQNVATGPKGYHDIIGELDGELMIFEVKGLTKAVGRKEIFDLERHIQEYLAHNPGKEIARGVLIANAYREYPPNTRDSSGRQIFAGDAVKHAELLAFALFDTRVIYRVVTNVLEQNDPEIGPRFLRHVRNSQGVMIY